MAVGIDGCATSMWYARLWETAIYSYVLEGKYVGIRNQWDVRVEYLFFG